MNSRLRRSLLLTTLLALLLGLSGAAALVGLAANPPNTKVAGIDVDATTIPELQDFMDSHRMNSVQLTNFYLRRIRQLNPELNAVITVSPTALADARAADRARRNGDHRPLLGIPIIVKDNVNTTGMPTTAGSWALAGSTPTDAFIAKQLKAAGAFIIGKANLSEWANFRSGPSSSGWSGIGGQTNMPYVLDRNPCGSSSGSGVVAAVDLAVAAVGTETDGSIVCPSGANGVVGIKPTLGLWSRAGVVPISAEQDTAGPIASNVTDAAVLLGAATGVDPLDGATGAQAGHAFTDYTQFLDDESLEGARIGVWRAGTYDPGLTGPVVEPILAETIAALEGQGATVVDNDRHRPIGDRRGVRRPALRVQDRHRDLPRHLRTRHEPGDGRGVPADARRPDRLRPSPSRARGAVERSCLRARRGDGGSRPGVHRPARDRDAARPGRDRQAHGRQRPRRDHRPDERPGLADERQPRRGRSRRPLRVLRRVVDCGRGRPATATSRSLQETSQGLPIGITFIGGRWSEPALIGYAYDFEQATHVRVPPQLIPTIGDDLFPGVPNPPAPAQEQRQQATQSQRDLVVRLR